MSATSMTSANALTLKIWANEDWINMGQRTAIGHMFARGIIFSAEEFKGQKSRGDQITYNYANSLTKVPVGEGGTLDGNEEALNLGSFTMAINVTRIGVLNPNDDTIEQQRTLVDFPATTRQLIPKRHYRLMDVSAFQQLAGAYPTSFTVDGTTWSGANRLFVTGHNEPPAPSSDRIYRAAGVANDQSITTSGTMIMDYVDYALEAIDNSLQPIEMLDDNTFDLFLAPAQYTDLKQDTSGKIQWFNMANARAAGGDSSQLDGMIYDTMPCLGQYGRVNIYSAPKVAYGVSSADSSVITTVRRAVLLGKDALTYASPFGSNPSKAAPLKYFDQLKDYGYYKGLEGRMIWGLKKTVATNSSDIGVYVISTYAAAHA